MFSKFLAFNLTIAIFKLFTFLFSKSLTRSKFKKVNNLFNRCKCTLSNHCCQLRNFVRAIAFACVNLKCDTLQHDDENAKSRQYDNYNATER